MGISDIQRATGQVDIAIALLRLHRDRLGKLDDLAANEAMAAAAGAED